MVKPKRHINVKASVIHDPAQMIIYEKHHKAHLLHRAT